MYRPSEPCHSEAAERVMSTYIQTYEKQMKPLPSDWKEFAYKQQEDEIWFRQQNNLFVWLLLLVVFPVGFLVVIWYRIAWNRRRDRRLGY